MGVEDAIAGDGGAAAGGDGALRFAFHAFVRVGLVNADVIGGVAVVLALGGGGGAVLNQSTRYQNWTIKTVTNKSYGSA